METEQKRAEIKQGKRPMARRPVYPIKNIDDSKELWKIAVRIVDLWTVVNKSKQEHMEMILMDDKGDKIQGIITKDDMGTWKTKLKEQSTYECENFSVYKNDLQFKVCDHPFKMVFSGGTIIKEKDLPDIPPNQYQFKDFGDILSGNFQPDMLVDLIGSLNNMGSTQPHGDLQKVAFTLKDLSGNIINCTLWDKYVIKFLTYFNNRDQSEPFIIIILTHAMIKPPQGKWPTSVSNTWYGSKLLINEDIPEIQYFKKRLPATEVYESSSQISTQMTAYSQFSDEDRFLYNAQLKSIREINAIKEDTTCVTVGKTDKFIVSKNGWSYEGCLACTRKTKLVGNQYICPTGHVSQAPTPRYKLEIKVLDKTDGAKFIFWDHDCHRLIGFTAAELMQQMIEEGEDNPKAYPLTLDKMLNRTMAYRIRVQASYNQSSVVKIWDDPQVINKLMDQIQPDEQTSKLDIAKSDIDEDVHIDTQSLSGTAEHDPEMLNSITPAKRISSDQMFDGKTTQEMSTAQLSSTKITKHVKTE